PPNLDQLLHTMTPKQKQQGVVVQFESRHSVLLPFTVNGRITLSKGPTVLAISCLPRKETWSSGPPNRRVCHPRNRSCCANRNASDKLVSVINIEDEDADATILNIITDSRTCYVQQMLGSCRLKTDASRNPATLDRTPQSVGS